MCLNDWVCDLQAIELITLFNIVCVFFFIHSVFNAEIHATMSSNTNASNASNQIFYHPCYQYTCNICVRFQPSFQRNKKKLFNGICAVRSPSFSYIFRWVIAIRIGILKCSIEWRFSKQILNATLTHMATAYIFFHDVNEWFCNGKTIYGGPVHHIQMIV